MSGLELVFYGELVDGYAEEQAKQHVAQLFKANADQVARMFTGNRVVIRNKLDAETAKKYVSAMAKRGCVCVVEKTGAPGEAVDLDKEKEVSAPQPPAAAPAAAAATATTSARASATATEAESGKQFVDRDNPSGLPIAGEKAAEILAGKNLSVEPVGARLSEEKVVEAPLFEHLDEISIAPAGSDLGEKKDLPPPVTPDTSHLKLQDED